jgi:hypothetical protein
LLFAWRCALSSTPIKSKPWQIHKAIPSLGKSLKNQLHVVIIKSLTPAEFYEAVRQWIIIIIIIIITYIKLIYQK